ncbi:hypothetical protein PG985_014790 [Apiospora marii]|uniref:uncharacterized protein n=1 Tax=Apiospora marii TaxID=335849 RepID=UPI00312DF99A
MAELNDTSPGAVPPEQVQPKPLSNLDRALDEITEESGSAYKRKKGKKNKNNKRPREEKQSDGSSSQPPAQRPKFEWPTAPVQPRLDREAAAEEQRRLEAAQQASEDRLRQLADNANAAARARSSNNDNGNRPFLFGAGDSGFHSRNINHISNNNNNNSGYGVDRDDGAGTEGKKKNRRAGKRIQKKRANAAARTATVEGEYPVSRVTYAPVAGAAGADGEPRTADRSNRQPPTVESLDADMDKWRNENGYNSGQAMLPIKKEEVD